MTTEELRRLRELASPSRRRTPADVAAWRLLRRLAALEVEALEYRGIELRALADGLPLPILSEPDSEGMIDGEVVDDDDDEEGAS